MKGVRNLLWAVPVGLTLSAPVWWPAVGGFLKPRGPSGPAMLSSTSDPKLVFSLADMVLDQNRGEQREMQLRSRRVFTEESGDFLHLTGVDAELFGRYGRKMQVASRRGSYDIPSQELTLEEEVRIATQEGLTMETEALTFGMRDKTLRSDELVQLAGRNMKISGQGLRYDLQSGVLTIGGKGERVRFESTGVAPR